MRKLTDEEWAHVREVLDAAADGKSIQKFGIWRDGCEKEWMGSLVHFPDLFARPESYRVKPEPETVTIYVHRIKSSRGIVVSTFLSTEPGVELLYSFQHEVQQ